MRESIGIIYLESVLTKRRALVDELRRLGLSVNILSASDYDRRVEPDRASYWRCDGHSMHPLKELKAFLQVMYFAFRNRRSKALLTFGTKASVYGCISQILIPNRNFCCVLTGLPLGTHLLAEKKKILAPLIFAIIFGQAKKIFVQNSDDYEIVREIMSRYKGEIFLMDSSGVDVGEIHELKKKNAVCFVSRLVGNKGIWEFLEVAKLVYQKRPDIKFHIAGPFDDRQGSPKRQDLMNASSYSNLIYHGEVDHGNEIFDKCDIQLYLSQYMEGVPRTLIECMERGLAVVTYDWRGCRECVSGNGKVFDTKAPLEKIADHIITILNDEAGLLQMRKKSRNLAEKRFNDKIVIKNFTSYLLSHEKPTNVNI